MTLLKCRLFMSVGWLSAISEQTPSAPDVEETLAYLWSGVYLCG